MTDCVSCLQARSLTLQTAKQITTGDFSGAADSVGGVVTILLDKVGIPFGHGETHDEKEGSR